MNFKRERDFLKNLCKGHISDLIENVGWNKQQIGIIKCRCLEFKSVVRTCMDVGISEAEYRRQVNGLYMKLKSYMLQCDDADLKQFYIFFSE